MSIRLIETAVFLDARSATDFSRRSLPGSHNVPADMLSIDGLGKAPMPGNDFNTRIILFASHAEQARTLADAIAKTPYQNVSYYPGTFESLAEAAKANK